MVVMGNPPYNATSSNKNDFIDNLLNDYKKEWDGTKLKERNPKWLNDDYVKFIRYSESYIQKNGEGILAFITAHGYLDNPTFRGMRHHLLNTFDKIYIIDLHGNTKKKEVAPDGSKDENVFDIMQGVSIALFIKDKEQETPGKVYYQDVYGLRKNKYVFLDSNDIKTIQWKELKLSEPYYFFVEKDFSLQAHYDNFFPVSEIFNKFSSGVKTHRDHFVIGFTKEEIKQRMRTFTSDLPDDLVHRALI